jgi:hypothetical protein
MNPREALKEHLMLKRHAACDGQRREAHYCEGDYPEMHEAIFSRDDARGSAELLAYTNHEINCVLLCPYFHNRYGRSAWFRVWVVRQQVSRYGAEAVWRYVSGWPGVINPLGVFSTVGRFMYWLDGTEKEKAGQKKPASRRPFPLRSP